MSDVAIALSPLDEQRFGVRTARANDVALSGLSRVQAFCVQHAVQMLIVRVPVQHLDAVQALEAAGARLMDTLVYYAFKFQRKAVPERDTRYPMRTARQQDAELLKVLAARSFEGYFGHYHADTRLDTAAADAVYEDWARNSVLSRDFADAVLVLDGTDGLRGFATLRMNNPEESEGVLYGVAPEAQGQGIYQAMIVEGLHWAREQGAQRMVVSTQITNVAVQKVWARAGYEFDRAYYTLHQWFDDVKR